MGNEFSFVPRILLCGDEAEFLSRIGERPFKIVGHAQISGDGFDFVQDNKIFFNDKLQDLPALVKFLQSGAADYFLFLNMHDLATFRNNAYKRGYLSSQVVTLEQFKASPDFLYDANADLRLLPFLKKNSVKTLLDVDGYFARGRVFTKLANDFTEIDAVTDNPMPPIMENIYTHVYKNLAEVGFKRYDMALIMERKPVDFDSAFILLENISDTVITFARSGSELEQYILANLKRFAEVRALNGGAVKWYILKRLTAPEDFCNYVVTHKSTSHEGHLPGGYKIIHAGRAVHGDLGYLGDDTGDNISHLNLYLNEITALYWLWKNTRHTTLGLCHYRRFFTTADDSSFAYDKILSREDALKILERYDIIVSEIYYGGLTQREFIVNDCGKALTAFGETILKKHLLQAQPDYLDAFDFVLNSSTLYKCNMFITRRNIFDAYCRWLFSFYLDAMEEVLRTAQLDKITDKRRRLLGYFSERMMTIWLWRNRLRIKELPIMFIEGI